MKRLTPGILIIITCLSATGITAGNSTGGGIVIVGQRDKRLATSTDTVNPEGSPSAMNSIGELISDRVGVQIKRYGGLGGYSTASIRGSGTGQVMVYLDGIPLNDAVSGEVNLEDFAPDSLERIEIYRSFAPLRFGISGIGGVINLVTRKTDYQSTTMLSGSYGSYNTSKLSFTRSENFKHSSYFIYSDRSATSGDFLFKDDNGTPIVNTEDDRWEKRRNNDFESYTATGKVTLRGETFSMTAQNNFHTKQQGIPGVSSNSSLHTRYNTLRNIASLSGKISPLFMEKLKTDFLLYYALKRDVFDDSENEIGVSAQKVKSLFDSAGGHMYTELEFAPCKQIIALSIAPQKEYYRQRDLLSSPPENGPLQSRDRVSMGLEDTLHIIENKLIITPQVRYDLWRDRFTLDSSYYYVENNGSGNRSGSRTDAQLGVLLYLFEKTVYLRGAAGSTHRVPSFAELFGDRGIIVGNPGLKPESSVVGETGIGIDMENISDHVGKLSFEYVYYRSRVSDIIVFNQNSQKTMMAQNISEALVQGHEVSLSLSLFNCLDFRTNYTYQQAIDRSNIPYYSGNYLPYRPLHEAAVSVKLYNRYGAISYDFNFIGADYRDRANSPMYYLKQRSYHGMALRVFPFPGLVLTFEVKNIGNEMSEDVIGYPLPGRSYYGSAAYTF